MSLNSRTTVIQFFASIVVLALTAGCAQTARDINSQAELAAITAAQDSPVVFGKLALIQNGEPVSFGDGMFANSAALNVHEVGQNRKFAGEIGEDGAFSWALPPGTYRIDSIALRFQDQTIQPETNFTFTVSPAHDASYLGTIRLETTYDSGYLGVAGGVDRYTVWNDCATECAKRLDELGLSSLESSSSLFRWNQEATTVASADVTVR